MEFDHLFICTSAGAPEADALASASFAEGAPNTHPGQGTSCRRFFLLNAYVELLWVHDPAEAQSAPARRTRLWERWSGRAAGACPFGFGFRPHSGQAGEATFSTWEYRPPYLPAPLAIHIATNADVLTEPMLFYLPFARRADSRPHGRPPPAQPRSPRQVTRVEFVSPQGDHASPELEAAVTAGTIGLRHGPEYLACLELDGATAGPSIDLRPDLPLLLRRGD